MNERVRLVLEHTEGPTVLDLGAVQHDAERSRGELWLHGHLANEFDTVIGIDTECKEVAKLNDQGYVFVCEDATQMDYSIQADTIVAGELIEHIADVGQLLERAAEHLKPGGKLIMTTPNPWAWVHLVRSLQGKRGSNINDEHVSWYGPTVMEQLLHQYGFKLVETELAMPERDGIYAWIQRLLPAPFDGTTWVFTARKT